MAEIFMAYFNGGDPNGPYDTWEPILQAPPLSFASWATTKNPYYFPWNTGWLIRIPIVVYYNPYIIW